MAKYMYFGALPWEQDGGAVVNYYLLKKQYEIRPSDTYYGIPKIWEQLDLSEIPHVNVPFGPDIRKPENIAQYLFDNEIPILNTFHLSKELNDELVDPVQAVGAKMVLHQTIHWRDDAIMNSTRLRDIDMIVAPTEYARSVFIQDGKVPRKQTITIPHGVDTTKFVKANPQSRANRKAELGIRPDQKVILYSGRLNTWKGIAEVIPIVRQLVKQYDCVFIFRGSAFNDKEGLALDYVLKKMAYNSPNVIYMPEWKSAEYMEWLYSFVDILLFNSGHEGFGVPLIEAQSVGAIPIFTALENHLEICLNDGEVGKVIAPTVQVGVVNDNTPIMIGSSDAVYGAIKWVLENPEEMNIMSNRGMARARELYDLTKVCQQWLDLYDSMIPEGYDMTKEALK